MKVSQIKELADIAKMKTSVEQGVTEDDLTSWSTVEVYMTGVEDGKILLARTILTDLGLFWE